MDHEYADPNRALSDLKGPDGWNGFIEIQYRDKGVTYARLDVALLFDRINKDTPIIRFSYKDIRNAISPKQRQNLFKQFSGRCNITGVLLKEESEFEDSRVFMKRAQIPVYDDRQPLSKTGTDQEHNLQLISEYANQEKNKICNSCTQPKCNICALAHPEKVSIIYPTNQDISTLRRA